MRVEVINSFRDKDDFSKLYASGAIIDFNEDRALHLIDAGLVKVYKPVINTPKVEKPVAKAKPAAKPTAKKAGK